MTIVQCFDCHNKTKVMTWLKNILNTRNILFSSYMNTSRSILLDHSGSRLFTRAFLETYALMFLHKYTVLHWTTYTHHKVSSALSFIGPFHYGCNNYHKLCLRNTNTPNTETHACTSVPPPRFLLSSFTAEIYTDPLKALVLHFHVSKTYIMWTLLVQTWSSFQWKQSV